MGTRPSPRQPQALPATRQTEQIVIPTTVGVRLQHLSTVGHDAYPNDGDLARWTPNIKLVSLGLDVIDHLGDGRLPVRPTKVSDRLMALIRPWLYGPSYVHGFQVVADLPTDRRLICAR